MTLLKRQDNYLPSILNHFFEGEFFKDGNLSSNRFSVPSVNILNHEKNFEIEVATPGFNKEDFSIELNKNVLKISTSHSEEINDKPGNYTRREFHYGSFVRNFTLPELADTNKISAEYTNGILRLTIPKMEAAIDTNKRIQIK